MRWRSGAGWWSDETVAKGASMNPSPPLQMTASALEKRTFVVSQVTQSTLVQQVQIFLNNYF